MGYSTNVFEKRQQLVQKYHQSLVPRKVITELELEASAARLTATRLNPKKAPRQEYLECMLGAGLATDHDLFKSLLDHFVITLCRVDPPSVLELLHQGPVIWLLGNHADVSAVALERLDKAIRQCCGTAVPFEAVRRPLLVKAVQGGVTLPPGAKVFVVLLQTHDEALILKLAKSFEAGKLATLGDYVVVDFRVHVQLLLRGHPDLLCKLKTAARRGMVDELLNVRSVAESIDALRQSYAGVLRVLAECTKGSDWNGEEFLSSLPLELLTQLAQRFGLQLLAEFDSRPGVEYETSSRKISLAEVSERMQKQRAALGASSRSSTSRSSTSREVKQLKPFGTTQERASPTKDHARADPAQSSQRPSTRGSENSADRPSTAESDRSRRRGSDASDNSDDSRSSKRSSRSGRSASSRHSSTAYSSDEEPAGDEK